MFFEHANVKCPHLPASITPSESPPPPPSSIHLLTVPPIGVDHPLPDIAPIARRGTCDTRSHSVSSCRGFTFVFRVWHLSSSSPDPEVVVPDAFNPSTSTPDRTQQDQQYTNSREYLPRQFSGSWKVLSSITSWQRRWPHQNLASFRTANRQQWWVLPGTRTNALTEWLRQKGPALRQRSAAECDVYTAFDLGRYHLYFAPKPVPIRERLRLSTTRQSPWGKLAVNGPEAVSAAHFSTLRSSVVRRERQGPNHCPKNAYSSGRRSRQDLSKLTSRAITAETTYTAGSDLFCQRLFVNTPRLVRTTIVRIVSNKQSHGCPESGGREV